MAIFGYAKVSGKSLIVRDPDVLAVTISTPLSAPVIAAVRLRGGNAGSARGAVSFLTETIGVVRTPGAGDGRGADGLGILSLGARQAVSRQGVLFCHRAAECSVKAAIAAIPATVWTPSLMGSPAGLLGL